MGSVANKVANQTNRKHSIHVQRLARALMLVFLLLFNPRRSGSHPQVKIHLLMVLSFAIQPTYERECLEANSQYMYIPEGISFVQIMNVVREIMIPCLKCNTLCMTNIYT